ncbi:MAG: hypothetical protein WD894_06080 [Pirellulales bacterium]
MTIVDWPGILTLDDQTGGETGTYASQLATIMHEFAHLYGAGEYRVLRVLDDQTGTLPNVTEGRVNEPQNNPGTWWKSHTLVESDPLFNLVDTSSVAAFQAQAKYSDLTAKLINDNEDGTVPAWSLLTGDYHLVLPETNFTVAVTSGGAPVSGATVKLYRITAPPYQVPANRSPADQSQVTNAAGEVPLHWPCAPPEQCDPHSGNNNEILLEVTAVGFFKAKRWLTVYDVQAGQHVTGGGVAGTFRLPAMKFTIELLGITDNPTSTLGWSLYSDAAAYGGNYLRNTSSENNPVTFNHPLPSDSQTRSFRVLATWPVLSGNSSSVPHTVRAGSNTLATFYANQTVAPNSYQDETGRWWQELGVIHNPPSSGVYTYVSGVPYAVSDAMRFIDAE